LKPPIHNLDATDLSNSEPVGLVASRRRDNLGAHVTVSSHKYLANKSPNRVSLNTSDQESMATYHTTSDALRRPAAIRPLHVMREDKKELSEKLFRMP